MKEVYLDYAATTPVSSEVMSEMLPYFSDVYGNPSSIHKAGEDAAQGVRLARSRVANFLNCDPEEIIFTSGATEGNNSVIKSATKTQVSGEKPHIVISAVEHSSVLEPAKEAADEGLVDLTIIPVQPNGRVDSDLILQSIRPETVLISIMYANNETGVIQPIEEIGKRIAELNKTRKNKIVFHTDAVQAVNYLNCDVKNLDVDIMTLSAHKIYGPKGVGVLLVKKGTLIHPLLVGGGQEYGLRAGTLNTAGIVGIGTAIEQVQNYRAENERMAVVRNYLLDGILSSIDGSFLNGSRENSLPNIANVRFEGVEGESVMMALNDKGFFVSTGSACASESLSPSHVLLAMGLSEIDAHGSVRFSIGRYTEEKDIKELLSVLPEIIDRLRNISGSIKEDIKKLVT
ncbi:MAG: cysteine desulfurase family protein [Candidatus Colwellbacteria bacterium]|nr:cysteine desulfurase family protein [Candidatus Colwellbacteria bacterium]